ncbi:MAG: hypothetical protein AAFQ82_03525 [Myxococcota bacterium]
MGTLIVFVVLPFPIYADLARDPGPGATTNASDVRDLECERLSYEEARKRYPGEIRARAPRGDAQERDALVCVQRIFSWGERDPRDEAILSSLDEETRQLVGEALARSPSKTWIVHTHYPNPRLAEKITFASKSALLDAGETVSDRKARLSGQDIDELSRLAPRESAAIACSRYAKNGSLRNDEQLLAMYLVHPQETSLHAGICRGGDWQWIH